MRVREKLQTLKEKQEGREICQMIQTTPADINLTPIYSSIFVSSEADKKQSLLSNDFCS